MPLDLAGHYEIFGQWKRIEGPWHLTRNITLNIYKNFRVFQDPLQHPTNKILFDDGQWLPSKTMLYGIKSTAMRRHKGVTSSQTGGNTVKQIVQADI